MSDAPTKYAKQLRLALVCSGGLPLAIYTHGVTKELFKLVRASRAFEQIYRDHPDIPELVRVPNPFTSTADVDGAPDLDSERAYYEAFVQLAREHHPVTVVLDVVGGTSAGGINGVALARGLAQGRSLNRMRDFWLDKADLDNLLEGHPLLPMGKARMYTKLLESVLRLEWDPQDAPLDGELMSRLLFDALSNMSEVDSSLVRPGESLDLLTAVTSVYGHDTAIPTGVGGISHTDRSYRQVLQFRHEPNPSEAVRGAAAYRRFASDFGDDAVPGLAFAARATSSSAVAFPAVSLGTFTKAIGGLSAKQQAEIAQHFVYGLEFGAVPEGQWFMDGGMPAGEAFSDVMRTIVTKRASGETVREVVYIEADPGDPPKQLRGEPDPQPTYARTMWSSQVTVPWHTPLNGVLNSLRTMNDAIAEVSAIAETQIHRVMAQLDFADLDGVNDYLVVTDHAAKARRDARQRMAERPSLSYATYCRLRAEQVANAIAFGVAEELGFPPGSNRAAFIAEAFGEWLRSRAVWSAADPVALEAELGPLDVQFRLRRTEFLLQGVNDLLASPSTTEGMRGHLLAIKDACWDLMFWLREHARGVAAAVREQAEVLFGPEAITDTAVMAGAKEFARTGPWGRDAQMQELYDAYNAAARAVRGSSGALWEVLTTQTKTWDERSRTQLLARYVGYPIWDSLIYPVIALSKVPQLSPVSVQRFSPLDASCLAAVDGKGMKELRRQAKLNGTTIGTLGGFCDRSWRENDYLWGRLDGAELVLRLLSRRAGGSVDLTSALRNALRGILAAERPGLSKITKEIDALVKQVDGIRSGALLQPPS